MVRHGPRLNTVAIWMKPAPTWFVLPTNQVCRSNRFRFRFQPLPGCNSIDTSVLGRKQLDILIPSLKLAIEFNGLIWHSSKVGTERNYHQEKTDAAATAGYRLIHIWSDEWIEKQDIIKAYLRMQLVGPDRRIGARKCSIALLKPEVALPFHRMFHLQGGRGENTLASIMGRASCRCHGSRCRACPLDSALWNGHCRRTIQGDQAYRSPDH